MNLNELTIRVVNALLKKRGLRRAGANHGIRGAAENRADASGAEYCRVARKRADLHRLQIHDADAAANAAVIKNRGQKSPALEFPNFILGLETADLLVERVKQLLAGGCSGKSCAMEKRASEAPEIQQALRRAVEHHAHAIEQIDNRRRRFAHALHQRLIGEEIAAVNRVVKMFPGGIAFALQVFGGVDAALGAHRMRALYRNDRK